MTRRLAPLLLALLSAALPAGGQTNSPPNAVFQTNPGETDAGEIAGPSPLEVTFNMCRSTDPDEGDVLKFSYDFDGDGGDDFFGACRASYTYASSRDDVTCTAHGAPARVCVWDRQPFPGHRICREYRICVSGGAGRSGPAGRFLLVANSGADTVASYRIDAGSGALKRVATASTGAWPDALIVHRSGQFAYVTNRVAGTISGFRIDGAGGALSSLGLPSGGLSPNWLAADTSGQFLYVTNVASNTVAGFRVDFATGTLTPVMAPPAATGPFPRVIAFDPEGRFAYVTNGDGTVSGFRVGTNGTLTPTPGSPYATGPDPLAIVVDPSGRYVYVGGEIPTIGAPTLWGYRIDGATGALSPVPRSPFFVGVDLVSLAITPDGRFLYASDPAAERIYLQGIEASSGRLIVGPGPDSVLAGNNIGPMVIDASGRFLYATAALPAGVFAYTLDEGDGTPTPLPGSPFAADAGARGVGIVR